MRTSGEIVRRIAMDGRGVGGTLTVAPEVAGSRGGSQRELAEDRERVAERAAQAGSTGRERRATGRVPVEEGPQSKEAVVARLFEAFSRRELLSALPLLHTEVVFQQLSAERPRRGEA